MAGSKGSTDVRCTAGLLLNYRQKGTFSNSFCVKSLVRSLPISWRHLRSTGAAYGFMTSAPDSWHHLSPAGGTSGHLTSLPTGYRHFRRPDVTSSQRISLPAGWCHFWIEDSHRRASFPASWRNFSRLHLPIEWRRGLLASLPIKWNHFPFLKCVILSRMAFDRRSPPYLRLGLAGVHYQNQRE